MYQRILNDAIAELRQERLRAGQAVGETFASTASKDESFAAPDCQIETDLEILIPDHYVSNISERLILYKELDGLESDRALRDFVKALADRFGPVPAPTLDLVRTVALRRDAKRIGFDRVSLKHDRMTAVFAAEDESEYYQSALFEKILLYVQNHPAECRLKEIKSRLSVEFDNVSGVEAALALCRKLQGEEA